MGEPIWKIRVRKSSGKLTKQISIIKAGGKSCVHQQNIKQSERDLLKGLNKNVTDLILLHWRTVF